MSLLSNQHWRTVVIWIIFVLFFFNPRALRQQELSALLWSLLEFREPICVNFAVAKSFVIIFSVCSYESIRLFGADFIHVSIWPATARPEIEVRFTCLSRIAIKSTDLTAATTRARAISKAFTDLWMLAALSTSEKRNCITDLSFVHMFKRTAILLVGYGYK